MVLPDLLHEVLVLEKIYDLVKQRRIATIDFYQLMGIWDVGGIAMIDF